MRSQLEMFFAEEVSAFTRELAHVDRRIDPSVEPRKDEHFDQLNHAMSQSQQGCRRVESLIGDDEGLLNDARRRFQEQVSPWLDRSWIGHRARTKPRGYPGDYELLTALYDQVPRTRGFGGYMDLYLLDMTLTKAIRARWKAVRRFLIDEVSQRRGEVFILNVACGPCREYVGGIEHPDGRNIHVTCIDNDPQALEYVEAHVATAGTGALDIDCSHYNALRMRSARSNIRKFGRCDIVYSVGLCDYIPDRLLIPMLQGWRDTLNDDGVLYVAFKDSREYDKTEYQWLLDWYFFQRTEEECRGLFQQAGFDADRLKMTRDATGVIMNFVGRVKRPALVRVDAWEDAAQGRRRAAKPQQTEAAGPQGQ